MKWKNFAPPPSESDLDAFEAANHVRLRPGQRWFLQTISNGGRPLLPFAFPAINCPGGASTLHSIFGINHPTNYYDLSWAITIYKSRFEGYIPLGGDDVGGTLFIENKDQTEHVFYNCGDDGDLYHVANSVEEFYELLYLDIEQVES